MAPIRLGIVGCGAISQVQHLPNLAELQQEFEVAIVCDRSPALAAAVARQFHVPQYVDDYRRLLASDVEAVLLCHTDPKTEVALTALDAGKHVLIEKPMCFAMEEADAIIAAARRAGTVAQVAYMKVYDPAFELAQREVATMDDIRFVQVNHLHPDNALHVSQFHIQRFDDLPPDAVAATRAARKAVFQQAIGEASAELEQAFSILAGSMIHDLYGLRVMFGVPEAVVSTEIWNEGRALSTVLAYPGGARCVATWADLPHLWDFKETLEVYGDSKRVIVAYPTGFARGILSTVTVQAIEAGISVRKEPAIAWESPFTRELRHFYSCIREGAACRTPVTAARDDIALIIDIVRAFQTRKAG